MKYLNMYGVDSPEIEFTSSTGTLFVAPLGVTKKVDPNAVPFTTTGDWDVDRTNFLTITDYTGLDAPFDYKHCREASQATATLIGFEFCQEVTDDFFDVPLQSDIDAAAIERAEIDWASPEIIRSREMLDCHLFGCGTATETQQEWADYWVALRLHKATPVGLLANRPTAPDA